MPQLITSLQNSRIKNIVKLNHRRQRDARRLTIVEGEREVSRALQSGIIPPEAYICPELLSHETKYVWPRLQELSDARLTQLFEVTTAVFAKIAYRGGSGGILLVIPYLQTALNHLALPSPALIAVVEGAEKPGNLGAILRTADGAGVDGVIVSINGPGTDIHNPNVVRASLGTLFSVPVATAVNEDIIDWLGKKKYPNCGRHTQNLTLVHGRRHDSTHRSSGWQRSLRT